MFVDDEVHKGAREFLAPEVKAMANALVNSIVTHQRHPTYNTRTGLKHQVVGLQTAWQLLRLADGYRSAAEGCAIELSLMELVIDAFDAAKDYGLMK